MVSALVSLKIYEKSKGGMILLATGILAYLSFLIRSQEFILVLIVALPLFPLRRFIGDMQFRVFLTAFLAFTVLSVAFDYAAYEQPQWQAFTRLNYLRALITDFGAHNYLLKKSDLLIANGLSENDIYLLKNWFFEDTDVADPEKLGRLLSGYSPARSDATPSNIHQSIMALFSPGLLPILLAAALLAMLDSGHRVLTCWLLFFLAIVTMGVLGRPGVTRVYVPLVSLLLLAPFLVPNKNKKIPMIWIARCRAGILTLVCMVNFLVIHTEYKSFHQDSELVSGHFSNFPKSPVVVWGEKFPYTFIYPVLGKSQIGTDFQLYGLGVTALSPISVAFRERKEERGMLQKLAGDQGILLMADEKQIELLAVYCKEHLKKQINQLSLTGFGSFNVRRLRCE